MVTRWHQDRLHLHQRRPDENSNSIYVIPASGGSTTRLTHDAEPYLSPRWAPRKKGIEVRESELLIPGTSAPRKTMTEKEVNACSRGGGGAD